MTLGPGRSALLLTVWLSVTISKFLALHLLNLNDVLTNAHTSEIDYWDMAGRRCRSSTSVCRHLYMNRSGLCIEGPHSYQYVWKLCRRLMTTAERWKKENERESYTNTLRECACTKLVWPPGDKEGMFSFSACTMHLYFKTRQVWHEFELSRQLKSSGCWCLRPPGQSNLYWCQRHHVHTHTHKQTKDLRQ